MIWYERYGRRCGTTSLMSSDEPTSEKTKRTLRPFPEVWVQPPEDERIVRTATDSEPIENQVRNGWIASALVETTAVEVSQMDYIHRKPTNGEKCDHYYQHLYGPLFLLSQSPLLDINGVFAETHFAPPYVDHNPTVEEQWDDHWHHVLSPDDASDPSVAQEIAREGVVKTEDYSAADNRMTRPRIGEYLDRDCGQWHKQ